MKECLGLNISNECIRYAKVKSSGNDIKIETLGIKFYENLEKSIEQIIRETGSERCLISSNLVNENYYYFNILNFSNKGQAEQMISAEFSSFCVNNVFEKNKLTSRYIYSRNIDNPDQSRVMNVYVQNHELNFVLNSMKNYRLISVTPIGTTLPNLLKINPNKNNLIINLDGNIEITTVLGNSIYNVSTYGFGMNEILQKLSELENSNQKAYEILKSTTLYTKEVNIVNQANLDNLRYIVPVLFKVTEEIKNIRKEFGRIDNIYLTGIGSVINNIDIYFKDFFEETNVEILKPYFIGNQSSVNIKDYIECNSAIALALQGLGAGINNLNFQKEDIRTKVKDLVGVENINNPKKEKIEFKGFGEKNTTSLVINSITVLIFIIIYIFASIMIKNQMVIKSETAKNVLKYINEQLQKAKVDESKLKEKVEEYSKFKSNLENSSTAVAEKKARKNKITTMLNQIIYNIPKEVVLVEIENTQKEDSDKNLNQHIKIIAQSEKIEELAYFKRVLESKNVLKNVSSTENNDINSVMQIIIEGDL